MNPLKRGAWWLAVVCILTQVNARADQDALADKVAAFSTTVEASIRAEEEQKLEESGKSPQENAQANYEIQRRQQAVSQWAGQLKQLEAALRQNDLDAAKQLATNLTRFDPGTNKPEGWNDLLTAITDGIEEREMEAWKDWYNDVQSLVKDVHDGCLAAEHSADLDGLLVRTSVVQMKRVNQANVLTQRGGAMLTGITNTLREWTRYLDQRDAGNAEQANNALTSLNRNSEFPVLTVAEVTARMDAVDVPKTVQESTNALLSGLADLTDLPAVLERWKAFEAEPRSRTSESKQIADITRQLEFLLKVGAELEAGNADTALELTQDPLLRNGPSSVIATYKRLTDKIADEVLILKVEALLGPQSGLRENPDKVLNEAMATLQEKGDYPTLLELLKIRRDTTPSKLSAMHPAIDPIEHFLAARRFEEIGDILMTVAEYRVVLSIPAGPLTPHVEATAALKRLKEAYPEAFKDYEGPLMQELQMLRLHIRGLSGGRYYPSGRYPGGR